MNEIKSLFCSQFIFITKALDIIFVYTKFNAECKEKKTFNPSIKVFKLSKWQINHLTHVL